MAGPICGIEPLKAPGTTKARAAFGRSDDEGALVRTGVTAYPKGMAAPTLAALGTATASCATYQLPYTDATGLATQVRVDVRQLEVGDPGDDRLGLRLSLPSLKQVILYGLVRRGDVISAVAQSAEKPDVVAFAPIIARADARLAKLVP